MLGYFLIILSCTLWALDTLIRYPLLTGGMASTNIVFIEHTFLLIVLGAPLFKSFKKRGLLPAKYYFYFFVVGGMGSALSTMSFTKAFMYLNPSLVILLQKFQPVVAISLSRYVLGEKIQPKFLFWASLCLVGALLASYEDILVIINSPFSLNHDSLLGYIFVAISVLGWGGATVFGKKLSNLGLETSEIMGYRFLIGFVVLLPFFLTNIDHGNLTLHNLSYIFLMVSISGLLAMYIYYKGLKKVTARAASLTEMFFPFMAIIVNWIFLNQTLSFIQIMGGVFLVIGSFVIQNRKL